MLQCSKFLPIMLKIMPMHCLKLFSLLDCFIRVYMYYHNNIECYIRVYSTMVTVLLEFIDLLAGMQFNS